ncbi:MerR family DNA-binding transcriptional regulator, partial [Gemella sp. 19428wG2_WT2a]
MNVKKASEIVGISEHTIRYYDKSGLFLFIERDNNGYRDFKVEDLYW